MTVTVTVTVTPELCPLVRRGLSVICVLCVVGLFSAVGGRENKSTTHRTHRTHRTPSLKVAVRSMLSLLPVACCFRARLIRNFESCLANFSARLTQPTRTAIQSRTHAIRRPLLELWLRLRGVFQAVSHVKMTL